LKTASQLSKEEIEVYRRSIRKVRKLESRKVQQRRERAWTLAYKAALILKEKYNANRVVVFGSLARKNTFTIWSDIDLAAWGVRPEDTFRAIGEVFDLDEEIVVNLVDINAAPRSIIETIEKDGIEI
jgi:uncharacterized protein